MTLSVQLSLALVLVGVVMMTSLWQPVASHGRLWTPPARGSMWRKGFKTPINYDDTELYCGGFTHQVRLGGKCGVCGDAYDGPRPNEAGGKYATGVIAATYTQGQRVTLQVDLTTSHQGWFEFKICPTNNYKKKATQSCMDRNVLQLQDGSGTKFKVRIPENGKGMINVPVILPPHLHCDFCVLQWRYHSGNTWGTDKNGKSCVGCGPQEEFYGCSDIRIKRR